VGAGWGSFSRAGRETKGNFGIGPSLGGFPPKRAKAKLFGANYLGNLGPGSPLFGISGPLWGPFPKGGQISPFKTLGDWAAPNSWEQQFSFQGLSISQGPVGKGNGETGANLGGPSQKGPLPGNGGRKGGGPRGIWLAGGGRFHWAFPQGAPGGAGGEG